MYQPEIRATHCRTSLLTERLDAAVAQLVEHVIRNDGVVGSSPISGTTFLHHTRANQLMLVQAERRLRRNASVLRDE